MHFLQKLEPAHIRQSQVQHHAVEGSFEHRLQCGSRRYPRPHLNILKAEQFGDALPLDLVVLDDEQPLGTRPVKS